MEANVLSAFRHGKRLHVARAKLLRMDIAAALEKAIQYRGTFWGTLIAVEFHAYWRVIFTLVTQPSKDGLAAADELLKKVSWCQAWLWPLLLALLVPVIYSYLSSVFIIVAHEAALFARSVVSKRRTKDLPLKLERAEKQVQQLHAQLAVQTQKHDRSREELTAQLVRCWQDRLSDNSIGAFPLVRSETFYIKDSSSHLVEPRQEDLAPHTQLFFAFLPLPDAGIILATQNSFQLPGSASPRTRLITRAAEQLPNSYNPQADPEPRAWLISENGTWKMKMPDAV